MAIIALEQMRFHAKHGFYEEEQIIGGEYLVDIRLTIDHAPAANGDDLFKTVNYETVYEICRIEMRKPVKLIETLAANILKNLKKAFQNLQNVKITIKKINPPLGGTVGAAVMELEQNFVVTCPKTTKPMICYKDENCWCMAYKGKIHPRTLEFINSQFGDKCISEPILKEYIG